MAQTPTTESYNELQQAYDYFNAALFGNTLPACLITYQREKHTGGYFSSQRFTHIDGSNFVDEIAMNPSLFAILTIEEILSILVHEMVHQWQFHFAKPGRRGYHNKEWSTKMQSIGLMPSDTGQEGGKKTGERMDHFIIIGGLFEKACAKLLTKQFKVSWCDRFPAYKPDKINPKLEDVLHFPRPKENRSNRVKYRCINCDIQLWGKPKLKVLCGNEECDALPLMAMI